MKRTAQSLYTGRKEDADRLFLQLMNEETEPLVQQKPARGAAEVTSCTHEQRVIRHRPKLRGGCEVHQPHFKSIRATLKKYAHQIYIYILYTVKKC